MNFREFLKKHRVAAAVFVLALVVRLALFFMYLQYNEGDFIATIRGADGYFEISENLIAGNGYSENSAPPYVPNSLRPPAWIVLMAGIAKVFGSYLPVFIFQLLLSSVIPLIGMSLAGRVVPLQYTSIVGVLLALEPAAVYSSTMVVSETSFTFLFLLFCVFLFKYVDTRKTREIVTSGVFLGLAILVKPTVQFLPVLIPLVLLLMYRKKLSISLFKQMIYFVAVCALVLAPWLYRNQKTFGVLGLTSQPAYNLYTVLVPTVLSLDTGASYESEQKIYADTLTARGDTITLANSKEYIAESVSIFRQHKVAFVKSLGISIVTFFTHDHMLTVLGYGGVRIPNLLHKPALVLLLTDPAQLLRDIRLYALSPGILVLLVRLFWVAITLLFFFGAWSYFRREKFSPTAFLTIFLVAYFAVMTAANGFGMNGRFRIPINAFLFIFALYGFFAFREYVRKFFTHA